MTAVGEVPPPRIERDDYCSGSDPSTIWSWKSSWCRHRESPSVLAVSPPGVRTGRV
jgi:hypothetical protein